MIEFRATLAIVRRHIDRRFAVDWAMQFAIVGVLAYIFVPSYGAVALPILAILAAVSVVETAHVRSLRRLTFFTVPLFGRELARAHAIAPALGSLAFPLGYVAGAAARGFPIAPERVVVATCVVLVATAVGLSGIFRDGRDRALYVALAIVAGSVDGIVAVFAGERGFIPACGLAVVIGFFALRAFGETLARYDPLPERDERMLDRTAKR